MASAESSKKLRILLIPFFATSHIAPHADLAVILAAARPGAAVEPTIAVTPANFSVVRAALDRHGTAASSTVRIASYPFPDVDGLPPGVENLSSTAAADAWRVDAAAVDEVATRPAQEALIRELSPDAVVTDIHFFWNSVVAGELGVPCVTFSPIATFSSLAMRHLRGAVIKDDDDDCHAAPEVVVPGFPGPEIRIPKSELPEFLRSRDKFDGFSPPLAGLGRCFGLAVNTLLDLEQQYCELFTRNGYVKRAYFVGPLSLASPAAANGDSPCMDWLASKPSRSVVYVCFGSLAHVSDVQLSELALGLEATEKPFLWVVRAADGWAPPAGWEEKVGDRGMVFRGWAPQTAILAHPAVGAFVTHCGWNSVLEAVVAGVPVLTWPMVFEQFITERFVTQVLGIGERLSPEGAVRRSTRDEEKEVVPAAAVVRAVARFMEPGGGAGVARSKVTELAAKARAAVAEGGSSSNDVHRLIDDLIEARGAGVKKR